MHRFSRRWLLVAASTVGLIGLGAADHVLPAGAAGSTDAAALRAWILAGARSYVGYAESSGRLGLPELPQLESTTALFTGTTRIRAFVDGPDRFRVDELTPVGERDTYRIDGREYVWDFGFDQLTRVVDARSARPPARLPRAADLLPPELARRLLALAPDDPVTPLPARRIAGRIAAGLRLVPTDPATTVGRVDVWADPATGLPLRVEIGARGEPAAAVALLATELRAVAERSPDPTELVPTVPPGAGFVTAGAADVNGALRVLDAPPPPRQLAGRDRMPPAGAADANLAGVGLYGAGLAAFALIPVSRGIAERVIDGSTAAGGVPVEVPSGRAVRLATPLLSVVVRVGNRGGGALLVGTMTPEVLERAAADLAQARRRP